MFIPVLIGVASLFAAVVGASIAGEPRTAQRDFISDFDSDPESNRPLSAQTTAGYSRLRQMRSRDIDRGYEPTRPAEPARRVRPSFDRVPVDRNSPDRPLFDRIPVDREESEESSLDDARNPARSAPNRQTPRLTPADPENTPPLTRPARRIPRGNPNSTEPASDANGDDAGLVADDGGPVAEILLHYSVTSEGELGAIYRDFFEHLSQTVRLQVCCPNEQSAEAFTNRWGTAAVGQGRSVHVINVNRPITVWARDRRICRQSADGQVASCFVPTAHATYDPEKQNDLVLPSLLWSTGLVPAVALTSMHLEGGNVVSNRRHVFVGANAFEDNEHRFDCEQTLFQELGKLFGRPTVAIEGIDGGVPWIHTDMYLTPIDSRTILVASPVLGCDLLPNRRTIPAINRGKPVAVEFDPITADSQRQQRFDDVARQLSDLGYQVIRMPALINVQKDWMVTYNNVIMDYQQGQRVVYMPVYNIPELDETASQTYRALGFEVKPIDVSAIFQLGGAIRCLANVTRRLPFEARQQAGDPEGPGRLQVYSVDPSANRVREIRPRREKRPVASLERDRQEQPDRDNSHSGLSVFGAPTRRPLITPNNGPSARDFDEDPEPTRSRPGYRADPTGRQPVDADF